jgi:hypothetical protein
MSALAVAVTQFISTTTVNVAAAVQAVAVALLQAAVISSVASGSSYSCSTSTVQELQHK